MPLHLPDFAAVIFDMDGLVLDTEITYFAAWQQAAKALGYELSDNFCYSLSGLHYQAVEQQLLAHCGTALDCLEFSRLSGVYWHETVARQGIAVKKGFFQFLSIIQKYQRPYCLATNSRKTNALECLQFAGLGKTFPLIVSRDCVTQGKPAPEIFFKAADLLRVKISACLILEDSAAGISAASKTPATSIYIPSSLPVNPLAAAQADFIFDDLLTLALSFAQPRLRKV